MNDTIFRYHCFLNKKRFLGFFFSDLIDYPAFPKLDSMTHVSMEIIKFNLI